MAERFLLQSIPGTGLGKSMAFAIKIGDVTANQKTKAIGEGNSPRRLRALLGGSALAGSLMMGVVLATPEVAEAVCPPSGAHITADESTTAADSPCTSGQVFVGNATAPGPTWTIDGADVTLVNSNLSAGFVGAFQLPYGNVIMKGGGSFQADWALVGYTASGFGSTPAGGVITISDGVTFGVNQLYVGGNTPVDDARFNVGAPEGSVAGVAPGPISVGITRINGSVPGKQTNLVFNHDATFAMNRAEFTGDRLV
jgi:hypothetical protein